MKKLIITCALITSASMVSFAQSEQNANAAPAQNAARQMPAPELIAERHAKMYEKQLNLTPEQYKGVYDAELDYIKQQQAARANGGQPGPGQHQQMLMAKDQRFKSILTADQYTKYDALRPKPGMPPTPTPAGAPAPVGK